jgi:hypothetical protein
MVDELVLAHLLWRPQLLRAIECLPIVRGFTGTSALVSG